MIFSFRAGPQDEFEKLASMLIASITCSTLSLVNTRVCRLACAHGHLILLPSPEKVNRPILSPLNDRPPSLSVALFTPGLQEPVGALWTQQVDCTGGLT